MPPPPNQVTTYHILLNMLHSIPEGDACLIWPFAKQGGGYGIVEHEGRTRMVHRLAWETVNGPIPDDMQVLHNCPTGDNPSCFRPGHLWLGTQLENVHDALNKGRRHRAGPKLPPQRGHAWLKGIAHLKAKLTEDQVREIRERFKNGETYSQLLPDYPVRRQNLWDIINRHTWRHI